MSSNVALNLQRQKELRAQLTVVSQEINGMLDLITSNKRSLAVNEACLKVLRTTADLCRAELEKFDKK